MDISTPLFYGEKISFAPIDHEKDPEIESRWTHEAAYMRMLHTEPMLPLAPAQVKKKYEAIEKRVEEERSSFYFTLRARDDDRLVGFIQLVWIDWSNGVGAVRMGIGEAGDRNQGYGSEALRMLVRYAFAELNLYRLMAEIPEYNEAALHVFRKAGFVQEICRREALQRDGRRWNMLQFGLLRDEWQQNQEPA